MSGSGDILLAPVLLAMVVPVAAMAATARAVSSAANAASSVVQFAGEQVNRVRINHASRKLGRYSEAVDRADEMAQETMSNAMSKCYSDYIEQTELLSAELSRTHDISEYVRKCEETQEKLSRELEKVSTKVEKQCKEYVESENKKIRAKLSAERQEVLDSISRISDSEELRKQTARDTAERLMSEAKGLISELKEECAENGYYERLLTLLENGLRDTENSFSDGMYEAAVINSYSVIDSVIDVLEKKQQAERKNIAIYAKCKASLEEIGCLLENCRSVDYTLEETADGQRQDINIDDFTVFFKGSWERIEESYNRISERINGSDFSNFVMEELVDLDDSAGRLLSEFRSEIVRAYDRLHNNLLRNEYADIVASEYEKMGFYEDYPDEDTDPIDGTVMMFRKDSTGEVIKISLSPEERENGSLEIGINIQSHDDSCEDMSTEIRRSQQRQQLCNGIMNSGAGKKLGMSATHSCQRGTQNRNAF